MIKTPREFFDEKYKIELGNNFKYVFYKYYQNNLMGICTVSEVGKIERKTKSIYEKIYSKGRIIICINEGIKIDYYTYINDELICLNFLKRIEIYLEFI